MTQTSNSPWSDATKTATLDEINAGLRAYAKIRTQQEESVERRTDGSKKIALPEDMEYAEGSRLLAKKAESEQEMHEFGESFYVRPLDGAYAFEQVLLSIYGMTAIGKAIQGWGGTQLPQLESLLLERDGKPVLVPWGLVEWPPYNAQFYLTAVMDADYGWMFRVQGAAKKKYSGEIQAIFMKLKDYLAENSVFKGKAIAGTSVPSRNPLQQPEFLDAYAVDRNEIVYNTDVDRELWDGLWGPIRDRVKLASPERRRPRRFSPKILVHGENGTGKTACGLIAAQFCIESGVTFVQCTTSEALPQVMRFAEHLPGPALVMLEDGDAVIEDDAQLRPILDILDGFRNKGREVGLLITSNHPENLPSSLMRAKRISRSVYISSLDAEALRRLIGVHVAPDNLENLDYEQLEVATEGFKPSWIVQMLEDADDSSVIRTGEVNQPLATVDFIQQAKVMRNLHDMHQRALERPKKPEFTQSLEDLIDERVRVSVDRSLESHSIDMSDGEIMANG